MKIKIEQITIENFKNIEHLQQDLGDFVKVEGANETGKTTFADAISWCLTGKSSLDEANPNIVPIDKPECSPKVQLNIQLINGRETRTVSLARVYQAKFNKTKEYTGEHQTVCFINDVKSSIKDFDAWIESHICNKEVFRLIHDVRYFTENITTNGKEKAWEAQRRLLFSICDIKSDSELAKKRKKFEPLSASLAKYDNANQYLLALKNGLKEVDRQIKKDNDNIAFLDERATKLRERAGDKSIDEIQQEIELLENRNQAEFDKWRQELAQYKEGIQKANEQLQQLTQQSFQYSANMNTALSKYKQAEAELKQLADTCPTCGAPIDKHKLATHQEQLNSTMKEHKQAYINAQNKKNKIEVQIADLKKSMSVWHEPEKPQSQKEYIDQVTALNIQLVTCEELAMRERDILDIEQGRSSLLDKRAMLQQSIDLCQEFIAYKCEQATKAINSMFDGVTFELFRQNKTNDEVKDCCDIFWQGVPYESLSYSTKFVIGLKIAQAFQKHYGVEVPLVVDNAESIDFDIDYKQQAIFLIRRGKLCPKCYERTGRKQANGLWKCKSCGHEFVKTLKIRTFATTYEREEE